MYVLGSGAVWVERGCEWMRELGLGFTNPLETGGTLQHVTVFWLQQSGWCRWAVGRGLGQGSGAVEWSYVCVRVKAQIICVDVQGPGICVLYLAGYLHI